MLKKLLSKNIFSVHSMGSRYFQGLLLMTWFNINPSMAK